MKEAAHRLTSDRLREARGDVCLAGVHVPRAVLAIEHGALPAGPDDLVRADLHVRAGKLAGITAPGKDTGVHRLEARGRMVLPLFADLHTHLDTAHIWPRSRNEDGTFAGAVAGMKADRGLEKAGGDLERRMDFAVRAAIAHGTGALRTHLVSYPPHHKASWGAFERLRARYEGRVALQAVSLLSIELAEPGGDLDEVADLVAATGGILGAVIFPVAGLAERLDTLFKAAMVRGLDLDLHVDETSDPTAEGLKSVAEAALRNGFTGRILAGHCCALALKDDDTLARTLALVREAGIEIVSLPMCNLYLQDRQAGRTPRWRGLAPVKEMAAAGLPVSFGSDNARDPFYAYGDLDMLEVFREAVRIGQLDDPINGWIASVTTTPAASMGLEGAGQLSEGVAADLIIFQARNWTELLARPQTDRLVLRAGRVAEAVLPDYAELDDLMTHPDGRNAP